MNSQPTIIQVANKHVFPDDWKRPQTTRLHGDFSFCSISFDYRMEDSHPEFDNRRGLKVASIDIFGLDLLGRSVLCHVHGFEPYFYSSVPNEFTQEQCDVIAANFKKDGVTKVELMNKRNIYGFQPQGEQRVAKITTESPKQVAALRTRIEENGLLDYHNISQTFESNVDFILRFMVDRDITGASWITIPEDSFLLRDVTSQVGLVQYEIDVNYLSLVAHPTDDPEWMFLPKLRILSFDIEVAPDHNHFPTSDLDPVIQICCYLQIEGEPAPLASVAFVLDTCNDLVGSKVYCYKTEKDLLMGFHDFVYFVDPDVFTGYNIANFDFVYMIERSKKLGVTDFVKLGRYKSEVATVKKVTLESKQMGKREGQEAEIAGRIQFDMLRIVKAEHKLRSYTLSAVSANFLNDQKEDVHYSMISVLQKGTSQDRLRLASYCMKDAILPLNLLRKLASIVTYVEFARVCRVPVQYLLSRGQQIRVFSLLLHACKGRNMIIPAMRSSIDDTYKGAHVFEPVKGWYTNPIPTLDFSSLYPSIMIAHNICYSTLVDKAQERNLDGISIEEGPEKISFVKEESFAGVLPAILKNLLAARKKARNAIIGERDPAKIAVYDGRQKALKVTANSVYGFTGFGTGKLPCFQIATTITGYGRIMIQETAQLVENHFKKDNGYESDAMVIYGDTDSVMVNFGNITMQRAIELGKEAAQFVSQAFPPPIHLEFEKAYSPYLLIAMKRYAGLLWTNPEKPDKLDAKGIEVVRRDNCKLVQQLLEISLNRIMHHYEEKNGVTNLIKSVISDLLLDRIDLSFLVISKTLSKEKYDASAPHVTLANKLKKRDSGSAPHIGDRVPYVIISGAKSSKMNERSEDPMFVLQNRLQVDATYYVDNQIKGPITRLFEHVFGLPAINDLFNGAHTMKKKGASLSNSQESKGTLAGFFQVQERCICGKASIKKGDKPVCKACELKLPSLYQEKLKFLRYAEFEQSLLWSRCQRCQKSLVNKNICTSVDCSIFYRRRRVQLDIEDAYKSLEKFDFMIGK